MAKNQDVFFLKDIQHLAVKFTSADIPTDENGVTGTTYTLCTGNSDDSIIISGLFTSTDTSSKDILIYMTSGSTKYNIGTLNIPLGSGFSSGVPSVSLMNNTQLPSLISDMDGNKIIHLKSGWSLMIGLKTSLTTNKQITCFITYKNY
jgi:hypothetical protein